MGVSEQIESSGISPRVGVSFLGAGAVYGVIQLLESQLNAFHLLTGVQVLVSLTVGVLGLLLSQLRIVHTANLEDQQRADALDVGMASFTPRHIGELSAFDLGVRRSEDELGAYVERDLDRALAEALENVGAVVVVGPERCGKTRTALHCIESNDKAVLLIPEDAPGLAVILSDANRRALRKRAFKRGELPVLWLDNLERFLVGLDLDALDRFQRPALALVTPSRWTWLRSRARSRLPYRRRTASLDPPQVRLPATLDEDHFNALLEGSDEASRTGRRLLARLQGIALGDVLSEHEQARFSDHYTDVAPGTVVSARFPDRTAGGWRPGVPWTRKAPDPPPFTATGQRYKAS